MVTGKHLCNHKLCFQVSVDEGYAIPGFCDDCEEFFCGQHLYLGWDEETPLCEGCIEARHEDLAEAVFEERHQRGEV